MKSADDQVRLRRSGDPGVNLVTFGALANGVGEASRVVGGLLAQTDRPVVNYSYDVIGGDGGYGKPPVVDHRLFDLTLSALNAPDHLAAVGVFPRLYAPARHRIGVWHWEVDVFPVLHRAAGRVVDEIWTTSAYQQERMAWQYRAPVYVLPLPVEVADPQPELVGQLRAGLGPRFADAFLFAFQFDWNSGTRRKNPQGVVAAYRRAFPSAGEGVGLLLKSINGDQHPQDLAELRAACADRPDILVVDEYWSAELNAAFPFAVDCYVSLHRSEGFGLTMAKAMAAGRPVVATGFSGNLDFMTPDSALLVPWSLAKVGPDAIYPANAQWAEPDLDAAADLLRSVADDAALRERVGNAARAHIAATRTEAQSVNWLVQRLSA